MTIIYVLVNTFGILLGIYRELAIAKQAIEAFQLEETTVCGNLYLYKVSSEQLNRAAGNRFECVWVTDQNKW